MRENFYSYLILFVYILAKMPFLAGLFIWKEAKRGFYNISSFISLSLFIIFLALFVMSLYPAITEINHDDGANAILSFIILILAAIEFVIMSRSRVLKRKYTEASYINEIEVRNLSDNEEIEE